MQVKKFEAPTIQEALDRVKSELGPEAIVLQTKKTRKGFGLKSQVMVEVTAAISERSMSKKNSVEKRLPEDKREIVQKLPAEKQVGLYEKVMDRYFDQAAQTQEQVNLTQSSKKITATRYADIDSEEAHGKPASAGVLLSSAPIQSNKEKSTPLPPPFLGVQEKEVLLRESNRGDSQDYRSLQDEVSSLKKIIEELQSSRAQGTSASGRASDWGGTMSSLLDTPAIQDCFDELVMNGVERKLALNLLKKVAFELGVELSQSAEKVADLLAREILETIKVCLPFEGLKGTTAQATMGSTPKVFAFIGPTGVGKTSTLVKLASELQVSQNLKLGLINFDCFKLNSFDQLATYGKLLQVPFRTVASVADLKMALSDFRSLDLVLIDTTGKSHKDSEGVRQIQLALDHIDGLETLLVLSATTRDAELYDAYYRFSAFTPQALIVSKLDEVVSYGGVYNLSQKVKCPLAYFTTGQKVPDDIEKATPERLVSLLMDLV
ncbi:flagellar biosynthesis protein FlhF [bacterium]|nr:flagellar biosynthesis protein FlhF [bacterium]